jgi:hypothetical protein
MKREAIGLLLVCALAVAGCGRSPMAPSALSSAGASGISIGQTAAKAAEQIVFSGVAAAGSTFPNGSPAGFWIWCQDAEAGNPYAGECNGAMYFYALGITKHVEGEVTEPAEGIYKMEVSSTLDDSIDCVLMNSGEAVNGPRNTVTVTCSTPSGSASTNTAVVNVTGP